MKPGILIAVVVIGAAIVAGAPEKGESFYALPIRDIILVECFN